MKIYRIWQLPHNNPQLFREYNAEKFDIYDYCCVWWDNWDNTLEIRKQLEEIFTKFNVDLPEHFAGHSLSVSDVIEVFDMDKNIHNLYYCQDIGFTLIH